MENLNFSTFQKKHILNICLKRYVQEWPKSLENKLIYIFALNFTSKYIYEGAKYFLQNKAYTGNNHPGNMTII